MVEGGAGVGQCGFSSLVEMVLWMIPVLGLVLGLKWRERR